MTQGKLTTRTGVPATNSYRSGEPIKMKLWLQRSGKLGHRYTVISNINPELYKLGKILSKQCAYLKKWPKSLDDLVGNTYIQNTKNAKLYSLSLEHCN